MPLDKGLDTKSLRTILIDELKYQYLVAHIADGRKHNTGMLWGSTQLCVGYFVLVDLGVAVSACMHALLLV